MIYNLVEWIEDGKLHEELLNEAQLMELVFTNDIRIISVKAL